MSNEVISGLIGASVGVTIAVVQTVLGYIERKRTKRDGYLFQAFQYFDGGHPAAEHRDRDHRGRDDRPRGDRGPAPVQSLGATAARVPWGRR